MASFVAQSHLTFVAPALGLLAVALACAVGFRVKGQGLSRRLLIVTAAVALVCWSAPLIDQAVHRPGNFVLLVRSATGDEPTLDPSLPLMPLTQLISWHGRWRAATTACSR